MKRFAGVIARATGNTMLTRVAFSDWMDLFQEVVKYQPNEKKVLVIDEFPYVVKTNPAFPSILQNAWDEVLRDGNVMLILCGSLIGMMQKYALSYDSPLYGRQSAQIRLQPLSFPEVYAHQQLSFEAAVEQFGVTGGVPKYLEFFQANASLVDQIFQVVLSKNGFLYEEPNFLLKDEVQSAINYFSIIKAIADGNHKLGKLASALGQETSQLTPYLARLIDLGFLTKDTPITEKNPEKSRKGLYFISDNFIRFWFRFVYPYKGELELENQQIVLDELNKDFIQKFVAFTYEDICKELFASLCRTNKIAFTPSRIGSYWLNDVNNDTQIDVAAVDHQNKLVFLGECKYHNKPVDAPVYYALEEQAAQSAEIKTAFPGCQIIYGLFSKSGFTDRMLDQARGRSDIILINEEQVI